MLGKLLVKWNNYATKQDYCWASMGNYAFSRNVLASVLRADAKKETMDAANKDIVSANPELYSLHDFGFDIIPMLQRQGKKLKMYDYRSNQPDKVSTTGYWRDVGTLDQFIEANMDLVGQNPALALENPEWPLVTYDESHGKAIKGAEFVTDSILANGVTIEDFNINRCVISYNTKIYEKSDITDSILMGII